MSVVLLGLAICLPCVAQPAEPARPRAERARQLPFARPVVVQLTNESRVIRQCDLNRHIEQLSTRHPHIDPATADRDLRQLASAMNVVILDTHDPSTGEPLVGVELSFYTNGIEALTPADRAWERMPQRIYSTQGLIDRTIAACRRAGRPLDRLIITGHSGIGGTMSFGDELHDCVFRGRLSPYHRDQLARLRPYLAEDAVIEIRQCTAGHGPGGSRLLHQLHQATGVAVESYIGDFRFGFAHHAVRKRADAQGLRLIIPQ